MAKNHPKSIILDHCWVCGIKFVDAGGSAQREDHHIIPRAYGGEDGPEVSVCDSHHTTLHKIAMALKAERPYFNLLKHEPDARKQKLLWLANQVYSAQLFAANDPNKKASVLVNLNGRQQKMIDELKKVNPKLNSRVAILQYALEAMYARTFHK